MVCNGLVDCVGDAADGAIKYGGGKTLALESLQNHRILFWNLWGKYQKTSALLGYFVVECRSAKAFYWTSCLGPGSALSRLEGLQFGSTCQKKIRETGLVGQIATKH